MQVDGQARQDKSGQAPLHQTGQQSPQRQRHAQVARQRGTQDEIVAAQNGQQGKGEQQSEQQRPQGLRVRRQAPAQSGHGCQIGQQREQVNDQEQGGNGSQAGGQGQSVKIERGVAGLRRQHRVARIERGVKRMLQKRQLNGVRIFDDAKAVAVGQQVKADKECAEEQDPGGEQQAATCHATSPLSTSQRLSRGRRNVITGVRRPIKRKPSCAYSRWAA